MFRQKDLFVHRTLL